MAGGTELPSFARKYYENCTHPISYSQHHTFRSSKQKTTIFSKTKTRIYKSYEFFDAEETAPLFFFLGKDRADQLL